MFRRHEEPEEDFKQKREEYSINIRRNNREEILNKRRNIGEQVPILQSSDLHIDNILDMQHLADIQKFHGQDYQHARLPDYAAALDTQDYLARLQALVAIRKVVDCESEALIKDFVSRGLLSKYVDLITKAPEPQIKLECIWLVANLTYNGYACQKLVENGVIQHVISLLMENEVFIVDHAIVALGNLAADNTAYRDEILKRSGIEAVLKVSSEPKRRNTYLNGIWAMSNLSRGVPAPEHPLIDTALSFLARQVKNPYFENVLTEGEKSESLKVFKDVLSTLSFLSERSKPRIDRILEQNILPVMFKCAAHDSSHFYVPAIRTIGNIANAGEKQTDALIEHGMLELGLRFLSHPKKSMRREMCWILSNIAAGTPQQVECFFARPDILNRLYEMLQSEDNGVKQEICWFYPNLGLTGDQTKAMQLYLHYDIIKTYVELLDQTESSLLEELLKSTNKLLMVSNKNLVEGKNVLLNKFVEYGGAEKLLKLQEHESKKVYKLTVAMIEKYFETE